jgi:type IV secretory pathway VirB2 component (pilin)
LLAIATTIAVIFIIIGGYQYAASGANSEMKEKSKKTLTWSISGLVVIILAAVIVNTLIALFG